MVWVIPREGQPKIKKTKNCLWYCIIYHIKEANFEFNMQKSLVLYYLYEKKLWGFEVKWLTVILSSAKSQ